VYVRKVTSKTLKKSGNFLLEWSQKVGNFKRP